MRGLILATALAVIAAPAAADTATAKMAAPDGKSMGTVELVQGPNGVLIKADLRGISSGTEHGFHIHETGKCDPDFGAAGDHFNPDGSGHGPLSEDGHHAGDLPNIFADDSGVAMAHFYSSSVTLEDGAENSLFDADGSAIILHAKPDSYGSEAGAGDRIACGVIERN